MVEIFAKIELCQNSSKFRMLVCLHVFNSIQHLSHLVSAWFSIYEAKKVVGHVLGRVGLRRVLQNKMAD